ncbi:hypothetical protein BJ742DRAFT_709460 [Cladochytrium replicatum]|nr:hypothetical protein BJ742DRAFT_709460 [Cladochytrium replicatum]
MSVSPTPYHPAEGNPATVGIYSSSGFDLMSLLAKVVARPNPAVTLGPVDMSSALLVVDATQFDLPIIHATDSFERLTGYNVHEIIGRNCRFLQSPDGIVERGATRKYVDNSVVYNLKRCVDTATECQFVNVNYKKGGQPFVNLITVVPIANDDRTAITYFVGFQVDLMEQSRAILRRLEDGQYFISSQNDRYPNLQNENSTGLGAADRVTESLSDVAQARLAHPANPRLYKQATIKSRNRLPSPQKPTPVRHTHSPTALATPSTRSSTALSPTTTTPLYLDPEFLTDYHLVQNSTEFVHILSSRGIILFASPLASRYMLEYEAGELVGRNMGKYVHPGDFINLMRELKRCSTPTRSDPSGSNVSVAFRFRRKLSGYSWMDVTGHRYEMSNRKRTKCFVLTARERSFAPGPAVSAVGSHWGSNGSDAWWLRVSPEGFILHAAPPVPLNPDSPQSLLCGFESTSIYGTLIYDLLSEDDRNAFSGAIERCTSDSEDSVDLSVHMSAPGSDQRVRYRVEVYPGSPEPTPCVFICVSKGDCKSERSPRRRSVDREDDERVFGCVAPDKGTSMRYELNRLMMANKYLEEEIQAIAA